MFWKSGIQFSYKALAALSAAVVGVSQTDELNRNDQTENVREPTKYFHKCGDPVNYVKNVNRKTLSEAISKSRLLIEQFKASTGAPGIVVAVTIDGEIVWEEGFGYSDVENGVPCTPETVMRIASISKSITMAAVAKLWEEGKLDMDKPVQEYVENFPEKFYNNDKVTITVRNLVNHTSGIRHYKPHTDNDPIEAIEFYKKDRFASVNDSLKLFKDDDISFKPGTGYLYTTFGFTLLSAIVEAVVKVPFTEHIMQTFKEMGMRDTYLDLYETIIPHRTRYYTKNAKGVLKNAPYVDNSYKWAGGGFISTVKDLARFGNVMLYCYQQSQNNLQKNDYEDGQNHSSRQLPGYLKKETIDKLWTPNPVSKMKSANINYGMGWVVRPSNYKCGYCAQQNFIAFHGGGAVGASSNLLILPSSPKDELKHEGVARGVVVAMFTNLDKLMCDDVSERIANIFYDTT